jgi:hypothetical protein
MTRAQREDLCHRLFDAVRERHGHQSRSPDRDADELPRYQDLLTRTKRPRPIMRIADSYKVSIPRQSRGL